MNYILENEEPKLVWHYFEEISRIPRGSYHTEAISAWLVNFAGEHGLDCYSDKSGNVLIRRPASAGCEGAKPLILQGHMDMVLEKNDTAAIDMEKEPITLVREGDVLRADGTTLGADDGIAVAVMLAALTDETLVHPPLECLFTVDEEVGLLGAAAFDVNQLSGLRMINLDSESEGVITAGCAGGAEQNFSLPVKRREREGHRLTIEIAGLLGGHSGECIHLGRANATLLMARVINSLLACGPVYLENMEGGNKHNAIPRSCRASVLVDDACDVKRLEETLRGLARTFAYEYRVSDPGITLDYTLGERTSAMCLGRKGTKKVLSFLLLMPNGLIASDQERREAPQTSSNLGVFRLLEEHCIGTSLVRSSVNSQREFVMEEIACLCERFGAELKTAGAYPAWQYEPDSRLREVAVSVYREMTGKTPEVSIIHGGLECGLLAANKRGLECISIGPDMSGVHTPEEKVSIASTARTWEYCVKLMKVLTKE